MSYTLINLWEMSKHTLFDDIVIPIGMEKETLINSIFDTCEECEPITADVTLLKSKIKNFFNKNAEQFNRLWAVNYAEYGILDNYDKRSTITRVGSNENKISAFDSSTYEPNNLSNDNYTTEERTRGNIGVTTSQQMLQSEINLWKGYNVYEVIANKFMFALTVTCY